jgi:hypothetical protein
MSPAEATPGRTNLVAQGSFYNAWVDLGLSVENAGQVGEGTATGTGDAKESPVEYFDLLFGIA